MTERPMRKPQFRRNKAIRWLTIDGRGGPDAPYVLTCDRCGSTLTVQKKWQLARIKRNFHQFIRKHQLCKEGRVRRANAK